MSVLSCLVVVLSCLALTPVLSLFLSCFGLSCHVMSCRFLPDVGLLDCLVSSSSDNCLGLRLGLSLAYRDRDIFIQSVPKVRGCMKKLTDCCVSGFLYAA